MQEIGNNKDLTPWMIQYYELKKNYPDSILFFRMWDFYEMFNDDALIANKVLWIALTTRDRNSKNPTPLAWIPFHAKDKYLPVFIEAWYKVAIAEQVSDPKLKWIVKREVVRVVTPATISLEWENFDNANSNIIAISNSQEKYWLSILNVTDNKWQTCEFSDFWDLQTELFNTFPKEVILEKNLFTNTSIKEILEKKFSLNIYYFAPKEDAYQKLTSHFWTKNLKWFWIENLQEAQKASSLLLEYLEANQKINFTFLNSISVLNLENYLKLDESTIRNLDLIYNLATKSNKEWTLFWVLNGTKTTAWFYTLQEAILKPLKNKERIEERLDFVEAFLNDKILLDKVRSELSNVSNISWIMNRLALNRATARDLVNLKNSLKSILRITEIIKESDNKVLLKLINSANV